MNNLVNDRGQRVIAVGAPGSLERVKCEYPQLVAELTAVRLRGKNTETCMRHMRTAGVRGMLEYESLLVAAGYEPGEAARTGMLWRDATMSLSIDLTLCQARLAEAGQKASAEGRKLKGVAPPPVYNELMLQLCTVASEVNQLKILLGSLRMIGELEQRPSPVTTESLELSAFVKTSEDTSQGEHRTSNSEHRTLNAGERAAMLVTLHRANDHSLDDDTEQTGSLCHEGRAA